MRGVGREATLFGVLGLQPGEHRVEAVGKLAELVLPALELNPMRQRAVRGLARGRRDARQRSEHSAGKKPPSQQSENQQERQHDHSSRSKGTQEFVAAGR